MLAIVVSVFIGIAISIAFGQQHLCVYTGGPDDRYVYNIMHKHTYDIIHIIN